jgi:putative ATPase
MRGSDADASLYYLAAMLEAGEDARFIARRMVILASEDVGNADPRALLVAVAAAQALEHVGLPEARLNLAQAAIYLARAPKSNAVIAALGAATRDVREHGAVRPPQALRDAHYPGAKKLGRGEGYVYPHDDPRGFDLDYLPEELRGRTYYRPSGSGEEHDPD